MRAGVLLLLAVGVWAHDLGYIRLDLHPDDRGGELVATAPTLLLASLVPPRVDGPHRVEDLGSDGRQRRYRIDGPRPLRRGDAIHLPWPRSGAILTVHRSGADPLRALIPRSGPAIVLRMERLGADSGGAAAVWWRYLRLGLDHILGGFDHLLFVAGLLLLIAASDRTTILRRAVATVTAFTVGHSLTLAAASLGWIPPAGGAVEALIALSILILGCEIAAARRGRPGLATSRPWLVAGGFGLLHGLGFAGALLELGLPPDAVPLALFGFNLGVEVGQILVVVAVVLAVRLAAPLLRRHHEAWTLAATYALGVIAATWTIQRTLAL